MWNYFYFMQIYIDEASREHDFAVANSKHLID